MSRQQAVHGDALARRRAAADAMVQRAAHENFPVALRLLPAGNRRQLMAVYAFARHVDDVGDEALPGTDRATVLARLDEVTADLDRVFAGRPPRAAELAPLTDVVRERALPREPFDALVEAGRLDQVRTDYGTREQLLDYCRLSAAPVGELVLRVFGQPINGPTRAASDDVCTALQLLEHWQDVGEDAVRGRVYLPGEDRARFGVTVADLRLARAPDRLRGLLAEETAWARELLARGSWLVRVTPGAARVAIAGYVAGGAATVAALARAGFDPLGQVVRPRRVDVVVAAGRLLLRPLGVTNPAPVREEPL